jgi:AraC family transcriptional activator FtrA
VVSICSGTFVLAASGLLDGRRAAAHWLYADRLTERFPRVNIDSTVLYVEDDTIFTSAGSAAGLDLCVHLVRQDFGAAAANALARRLLLAPFREGHQPQLVENPVRADPTDDRLSRSMTWALAHLDEPITVDTLARHAHMSTRTYLRHFADAVGTSPIRWLINQRVHASLPLLENTQLLIEQVAAGVGFDRAVTFRYHFARTMGTSPTAYRRAFTSRQLS